MALAPEVTAPQPPSSTAEDEEVREQHEATSSLFSSTDGTDKAGRSERRRRQHSKTEKVMTTVTEKGDADPDRDCDSSSTEDLDIDPAEYEFEEPDIVLQPEEVQQKYSARQSTQDDDIVPQSLTNKTDIPSELKKSVDRKSSEKKRKSSPLSKPRTKETVDLNLDSAETQTPQSLASVTQIPETMGTEEVHSKASMVPAGSRAQDGDKGKGSSDSQKSSEVTPTHTSSSTLGVNSSHTDTSSPTQSPEISHGPAMDGYKPSVISSLNSDNPPSSASATPSQSLLQPAGGEKQSTTGMSESNVQQSSGSATTSPSQSILQGIGGNSTIRPNSTRQSEGKLDGLPAPAVSQTLGPDYPTLDDRTCVDESEETGCESTSTASQKMSKFSKGPDEDRVCLSGDQAASELLVPDTQYLEKPEEQSVSLLSQQVVLDSLPVVQDSLPECAESSQQSDRKRSPQISFDTTDTENYPSPTLKSPRRNLSVADHTTPASGKRKRHDHKPSSPLPAPEPFPSKSPSSVQDKVVSSAPPRTTSLASDSDDCDAVPVLRRTKRKCFSLGGSPLESKTPLSIKRRRYRGKQKNLSEEFDKEADSGAQQSLQGSKLSQTNTESKGGKGQCEKDQLSSSAGEHELSCINAKQRNSDRDDKCGGDTKLSNMEKSMDKESTESVTPSTRSKISPFHLRKKTVRGLARHKAEPSDSVGQRTSKAHDTNNAENSESGIKTDMHTSEADLSVCQKLSSKERLAGQRQALIQVSDDSDLMEVDDVGISADSGKMNLQSNNENQNKTWPRPAENKSVHEEPAVTCSGSEDTVDKPTPVSQSSDKSQTQKPQFVNQSSVPASMEDATIPPPSFDLRFDDEDEEDDENTHGEGGLAEQSPQETADHAVISEQLKSIDHSDSLSKRNIDRTEQNGKQSRAAEDKGREEGEEETVSTERLVREEVGKIPADSQGQPGLSGGPETLTSSSEEDRVVARKRKKPAVIISDSDNDSDHGSEGDSEASLQLNFTSSSAVSSQSEILTTQDRSKMESELDRLRREIAEVEAKLQGQSSRSDSNGDHQEISAPVKSEAVSALASDDSSDDDVEESSGHRAKKRGRTQNRGSSRRGKSSSGVKRARRCRRISSDDEDDNDEEEESRHPEPKQRLMDGYLCEVKAEADDPLAAKGPVKPKRPLSPLNDERKEDRDSPITFDEDSSDLFLSPLSPSPPPPTKHSLARADLYGRPQSLAAADSPSSAGHSLTKVRQSLDFATKATNRNDPASNDVNENDSVQQDSQEFSTSLSGKVKKIPESQFSVSSKVNSMQVSDLERSQQGSPSKGNVSAGSEDGVDSSGSPLPSPLKDLSLTVDEKKESVDVDSDDQVDDDELPRWKRKKFGFISSGLDQRKLGLLRKLAEANECKVYSKFNDYVTHVVMKTEKESRVCERTLKYFQGIACQCWVLSFDWVLQSLSQGCYVPETAFEIQGDTVKGDNHRGPSLSRLSSTRLLEGFAFAPVGVSSDMSKKELSQLLTLCGGEVVEDPWALASHPATHKLVLRCVDSEASPPTPAETELFNGQYKHFGLVTAAREWILDSVGTHCLQPLKDYVFNTCPNLRLPF
ncbi:uncharacterized protein LOC143299437 [Babylonia areolata]|uniref:uncharacterized protein LOC143299437 n=1 Tax=Babylonia areolata TaxID=304850 RepID=UPI003FD47F43